MKHCFYFYFLNIYLFTCLGWVLAAAHEILRCGLWDPVSWPGTEHGPPALGARRLSHWITTKCRYVIYLISTDSHLTIAFTRGCSLMLCVLHTFFLDSFLFTCLFYDFYDAIYNSHNSLISALLLFLHTVWEVPACGDSASLLTGSWLAQDQAQSHLCQHFATRAQRRSRLHVCGRERCFFQISFLMRTGVLITGRAGPPPLTLSQLTRHWSAAMVPLFTPRGSFWYTLGVIFLFEDKFFSSVLKSINIYSVD